MATETLPLFPGCTDAQLKQILITIASSASVMVELAIAAAECASPSKGAQIHALQFIAERIGTLADLPMSTDRVHGSFGAWTVDSEFDRRD